MALSLLSAHVLSPAPEGVRGVPRVEVSIKETPAEVIVLVIGEVGLGQVDELAAALLWLSARRPKLLTLDLSGLTFISSLAMGVLVSLRRGVVRAGGRVRLAATLQGPVREALVRADLFALFKSPEVEEDRPS